MTAAESSEPCYDTNVLARTLSWLDHNNPHWPMQSYEAARTAYHHHEDCPPMTCATYIAALYKIRKSHAAATDSAVLHQRATTHAARTRSATQRKRRPAPDHTVEQVSPHPEQPDVRLAVVIDGHRLDFAACLTSALWFLQDQYQRRFVDSVEVIPGDTIGLRRLPNERLYDGP